MDKELGLCVTTIREFRLCSFFLWFLEITEDSTTILVTQFLSLVEEWGEVSFGLGLALLSGWLAIRKYCPCFCPCFSDAFDLGLPCVDFYTLMSLCLLLLEQPKQGILRNDSSMPLIPFALPEVKGKAGSNSSPSFVVLFFFFLNQQWEKASSRGVVPSVPPEQPAFQP